MVDEFISEDDLQTFKRWLRYHSVDAATTTPEELEIWRRDFEDARERRATSPKFGLMKLQRVPGEYRYNEADLFPKLSDRRTCHEAIADYV